MPFLNNISGKFGFGRPTADRFGSIRFNSAQRQNLQVTMTAIGTSTATVEFWFYADANNIAQRLFTSTAISLQAGDFAFRYTASAFIAGDGAAGITSSTLPDAGVWNHVAWVGTSGTSQSLYLNGSRVGTGTTYNFTDATPGFFIGGRNVNAEYFNGYISNFRYVIGTAVYTGTTYTVPTIPLYPDPGTELLLKTLYGPYYAQDYSPNNYSIDLSGLASVPTSSLLNPFS
jgi:hypothetical protein